METCKSLFSCLFGFHYQWWKKWAHMQCSWWKRHATIKIFGTQTSAKPTKLQQNKSKRIYLVYTFKEFTHCGKWEHQIRYTYIHTYCTRMERWFKNKFAWALSNLTKIQFNGKNSLKSIFRLYAVLHTHTHTLQPKVRRYFIAESISKRKFLECSCGHTFSLVRNRLI